MANIGYGKNAGNWNFKFAAEAARVETRMLRENLTIAELARMSRVASVTMKEFLLNGTHNKAYTALKRRGWL